MKKRRVKHYRNIVIKVGTSILTRDGHFDRPMIKKLADEVSGFMRKGARVSIVSSGAIGAGMTILKEAKRPRTMEGLQAAAAVGQRYLMQCYEEAFSKKGFSTAQVLLTWDDLSNHTRYTNARNTLKEIQRRGLVPIINENDTVATDEIRFGDNDRLSSLLAILVEADAQIILSDTNGLFAGDRTRTENRLSVVEKMTDSVFSHAKDRKNSFTVGGMQSKLKAVRISTGSGIPVFLADGRENKILTRLLKGEDLGTLFLPDVQKRHHGKNWAFHFMNHIGKRAERRG